MKRRKNCPKDLYVNNCELCPYYMKSCDGEVEE